MRIDIYITRPRFIFAQTVNQVEKNWGDFINQQNAINKKDGKGALVYVK